MPAISVVPGQNLSGLALAIVVYFILVVYETADRKRSAPFKYYGVAIVSFFRSSILHFKQN